MKPFLRIFCGITTTTLLAIEFAGVTWADDPATSSVMSAASTQPATTVPPNGVTGDWFGSRTKLADKGITFTGAIDYDYSRNIKGGTGLTDYAGRELTNVNIALASDPLLGWQGGTFLFNFQNHATANNAAQLVGDAQGFDSQDGAAATQLYQAWYQQTLLGDQFRIKIGRVDANTEFAYVTNGLQFLNASFGYSAAIFALPTYPDPALSTNAFWTPNQHFYIGSGFYDANTSERSLIFAGHPDTAAHSAGGVFSIIEAGAKWALSSDGLPGRVGVGGYHHNGQFLRFDGTAQDGAAGAYAVCDQTLWQPANASGSAGVGFFLQGAFADPQVSLIDQQIGGGLAWTGPLPGAARAADVLGIGATAAHFSNHAGLLDDHELAVETFYKIQFTSWFSVQPDLQYIVNPGGNGNPDAWVGTIRVELDF